MQKTTPAITTLPAGNGPRHLCITSDERFGYVVNELDETVCVLQAHSQGWALIQTLPVFECEQGVEGALAAIRLSPDEKHLYVSGRRQSAIAAFPVDTNSGMLSSLGQVPVGGLTPRDFLISRDWQWVIVASQDSYCLKSFRRDPVSGGLTASGHELQVGSPVSS